MIPAQHPDTPWETRGDKGRQSKVISAQHPDIPWETKPISIDVAAKAVFEWVISCQQELQTDTLGDAKHWGASFAS